MNTQDILNFFLVLILLVATVCAIFITYFLVRALKAISSLADSLQNTSESLKGRLQLKALAALPSLLIAIIGRILKRGR